VSLVVTQLLAHGIAERSIATFVVANIDATSVS
jgi:hypothetical protein